jgi:hypothetical protein
VINTGSIQELRGTVAVDDEPLAAMDPVDLIETAEPPTGIDDGEDHDGEDHDGLDGGADAAEGGEQS